MIQEIKIKNFLSFKDEVRFSFDASNDKFAEDCQVVQVNENTRLLRFAVVYGYNASGKSNLLKAFKFLKDFWFENKINLKEKTGVVPFKLDAHTPKEHTRFELFFFVGSIRYNYQLELDSNVVYLEKLSYYKTTQPIKLFVREFKDNQSVISYGSDVKVNGAVKNLIAANCLNNMSFFAARNKANANIPLIDDAKDWLDVSVMPSVLPTFDMTSLAYYVLNKDEDFRKYILDFLGEADFNVTNILSDEINNGDIKTDFEHTVENERGTEIYKLSPEEKEESMGTMRTFGLESHIFSSLKYNLFVPIDEIESSLHPQLIEKILYEFLRKTDSRSQLLVTTHYDGLLDLVDDLIRKDSVWFTEKQNTGATDLYKLTDFRGVNRLSSIRDAYRNKRFGATMK